MSNREEFEKWTEERAQGQLKIEQAANDELIKKVDSLRGENTALKARVEELRYALKNLLDDTQHKEHANCESGPCPVREARETLAAAPTPPAQEDETQWSRSTVSIDLAYLQSLEDDSKSLDKLRKAAEEIESRLRNAGLEHDADYLRSALEAK